MLDGLGPRPVDLFVFREFLDISSECTLDSGGAAFNGFTFEAFDAVAAFEAFAFLASLSDSGAATY
jgi:hypothetical protein